jgi:NAD kinase
MAAFDKIVIVTQRTALQELVQRYNTKAQAKFYLVQNETPFTPYQESSDAYVAALGQVKAALPGGVRTQFIDRDFLPNFLFGEGDLVLALGRDGLVVNIAKYLSGQVLVGINPDPRRIDGVLVRFHAGQIPEVLRLAERGGLSVTNVTMARVRLSDGQSLYAVNDLFIGQRTHVSARYRLGYRGTEEDQSSSGIIVSTGAGSTGWLRSILAGAAGVVQAFVSDPRVNQVRQRHGFDWSAERLVYSVREPFVSKTTQANLVFGPIEAGEELVVTSHMPQQGVIFSDGVESDYLEFNSGRIAHIGLADRKVRLAAPR